MFSRSVPKSSFFERFTFFYLFTKIRFIFGVYFKKKFKILLLIEVLRNHAEKNAKRWRQNCAKLQGSRNSNRKSFLNLSSGIYFSIKKMDAFCPVWGRGNRIKTWRVWVSDIFLIFLNEVLVPVASSRLDCRNNGWFVARSK